ncbi:MAG: PqqD family protein [Anaerolineales bacterium]|nr:PqqD family protein [Anaerolineales bacterium]
MELSAKPRQKPDYRLEKLDDELLLYHPGRTAIMYCNTTASLIWQLCDGLRTGQEIANLLSTAYEQPTAEMAAAVAATLEQFCRHGAIELDSQSARQKSG